MSKLPPDWAAVRSVFERALALDAAARAVLLADPTLAPALVAEVRSLLAAAEDSGSGFLAPPALPPPADGARPGQRLGAWRLVARLGAGGMGEVWRARRDDGAYEGEAALKLLRAGLDSAALLARFAQEQRSLARLNHPNIARLYDAGLSADRRPFFVMELVEGEPLDHAARPLPLEARLALFLQLADAMAHAHRQLLVHRDLKPGNVLVDRSGQIKLLDFGIAKALDPLEARPGEQTVEGQRPFTPHYASPEQVRGEPVGTGTDVYSLGVLLYLLLTGVRPTGRSAATAADAMQAVLEEAPAPPSRLSVADAPALHDPEVRQRLRGDLDFIALKALEKSVEQRHPGVDALAADVRAYLAGRPLATRPAGPAYVLGKFVRRNRWAVLAGAVGGTGVASGLAATLLHGRVAAALGVVGLAGGLGLALFQGRKAEAARVRAERHVGELRRLVREVVVEYGDAITHVPGGHARKAAMLNAAADHLGRVAHSGRAEPGLQAELGTLHARIAKLYTSREYNAAVDLDTAERHARQAAAVFGAAEATGALDASQYRWWGEALGVLGESIQDQRHDPAQALVLLEESTAVLQRGLARYPANKELLRGHAETLMRRIEAHYGWNKTHLGQPEAAMALIDEAIALYESASRDDGDAYDLSQLGTALSARAMIHARHERWAEALPAARRGAEARAQASAREPHNQMLRGGAAADLNMVGGMHLNIGDAVGALEATTRAWAMLDTLLAAEPGHATWVEQRGYLGFNHGRALAGTGRAREALDVLQVSVDYLNARSAAGKGNTFVRRRLALTQAAQADALRALGDARGATLAQQARTALQALVAEDPNDRDSLMALGECACGLARAATDAASRAAWKQQAAAHYARAAAIRPLTAVHAERAAWAAT